MSEPLQEARPLLASVKAAAVALDVSEERVRAFMREGVLPLVRIGGSVKTRWDAINRLAQEGTR